MSRVGKLPILIPDGVQVDLRHKEATITGPKGNLNKKFKGDIDIKLIDNSLIVDNLNDRPMWGTVRSILNNMVTGVKHGFKEELELIGIGYRASVKDDFLTLFIGKSHSIKVYIPQNIKIGVSKQTATHTSILLETCDKELLGQFVSSVIKHKSLEAFKGKGIKFKSTIVKKKEGKKTKK